MCFSFGGLNDSVSLLQEAFLSGIHTVKTPPFLLDL